MKIRAFLYDLARNQNARPTYLKFMIGRLAGLGFNMLVINLEHRFQFATCPGMAPPGSLTAEQARALVRFGRSRGVEVVAQPNFIGHCEGWGALERYAHLSCDPWLQKGWGGYEQINFSLPQTRSLVSRMLEEICEAFPGDYLHIGADEIRRMEYLHPGDASAREAELANQLADLLAIAKTHGRRLMMWGDMLLSRPNLRKSIPKDILICDWHYEAEGSRQTLAQFHKEGFPVLATPAVSTCYSFLSDPVESHGNIGKMLGDARDLGLDGFLLTSWHFSAGSSYDLVWPWVAFAGAVAAERRTSGWKKWLGTYFEDRHGGNGRDFVRLHELLHVRLASIVGGAERLDGHLKLARLRYALFRGAEFSLEPVRPAVVPESAHAPLWEPSPFHVWLILRPILTKKRMNELRVLAVEVGSVVEGIGREGTKNRSELLSFLVLGRAFVIMIQRLELLEQARSAYHEAAQSQPGDRRRFTQKLARTAHFLEKIRPGIRELRVASRKMARRTGIDVEEAKWLAIHEKSLAEHIAALKKVPFEGDALLEFGEFLRRPAHITQRVPWR